MKSSLHWLLALMLLLTGCSKDEPAPAGNSAGGNAAAESDSEQPPGNNAADNASTSPKTATPPTQKTTNPPQTAQSAGGLDLKYITDDFTAAIVVYPARILSSPLVKDLSDAGLPVQRILNEFEREVKIDPKTVEQFVVLVDKSTAQMAPMMLGPGAGPGNAPAFDEVPDATPEQPLERKLDKEEFGSRATDRSLQFVSAAVQPGGAMEPPMPTAIMRLTQPMSEEELLGKIPVQLAVEDVDGLKVHRLPNPGAHAVLYQPDQKTIIVTRPTLLKKMLEADSVDSPLIRHLKQVDPSADVIVAADLTPLKPMLAAASAQAAGDLPTQFAGLAQLASKIDGLSLSLGITGDSLLELNLTTDSEESAQQINSSFTMVVGMGKSMYANAKTQQADQIPLADEQKQTLIALADALVGGINNAVEGKSARLTVPKPEGFEQIVDILKPTLDVMKQAQKRAERINDFKQIGLAMHNYHDTHGEFPAAGAGPGGQSKGLSWRVYLLPYLDQAPLYEQFHLDEPWDSEHNKTLIPLMPRIFTVEHSDPAAAYEEGYTPINVFVGDNAAFQMDKGRRIREFTDGTSNTILVIQGGPDTADVWTKPGGIEFDGNDVSGILDKLDDSFLILMADGSTRTVQKADVANILKGLITCNGGEIVQLP